MLLSLHNIPSVLSNFYLNLSDKLSFLRELQFRFAFTHGETLMQVFPMKKSAVLNICWSINKIKAEFVTKCVALSNVRMKYCGFWLNLMDFRQKKVYIFLPIPFCWKFKYINFNESEIMQLGNNGSNRQFSNKKIWLRVEFATQNIQTIYLVESQSVRAISQNSFYSGSWYKFRNINRKTFADSAKYCCPFFIIFTALLFIGI